MRAFRYTGPLPPDARGAVVAIGNFDGVHLGHQAVIHQARAVAASLHAPLGVLTFEPHPRRLFRPQDKAFRLTPWRAKARVLEALGIDLLYVGRFDRAFSLRPAEAFVAEDLAAWMGVRHVVVGADFAFGHHRAGNAAFLEQAARRYGFGVTVLPPVQSDGGVVYSSTRIRTLLAEGDLRGAAGLLGRPFEIEAPVIHGDQRGRQIGFPTANMALGLYQRPAFGVYAVRVGLPQGQDRWVWQDGVANLGRRPTFGQLAERLESHLFNFDQDLYGQRLRIQLLDFLRSERKFDGIDALKNQIAQDAAAASRVLFSLKEAPKD